MQRISTQILFSALSSEIDIAACISTIIITLPKQTLLPRIEQTRAVFCKFTFLLWARIKEIILTLKQNIFIIMFLNILLALPF